MVELKLTLGRKVGPLVLKVCILVSWVLTLECRVSAVWKVFLRLWSLDTLR